MKFKGIIIITALIIMLMSMVNAAPTPVSISDPTPGQVVWTNVSIAWSYPAALDPNTYIITYNVSICDSNRSGEVAENCTQIDNYSNSTFNISIDLTNNASGYYQFQIWVTDNSTGGNSSAGYSVGAIIVDHTAPNVTDVTITSSDGGYYYTTSTLTCTGTFTDPFYGANATGNGYLWFVDGTVVAGATGAVYNDTQTNGATLICEYTPSDGYNNGTAVNSSSITLEYSAGSSTALSCQATKTIIYAGFGLIAVGVVVLAGFLIVSLFRGDGFGADAILAVVVGGIAVAVVVLVGYYLIDVVANAICSAAI